MLRTPLFPIDKYIDIFCRENTLNEYEDKILEIVSNDIKMRESILISSLSLYNELENLNKKSSNMKKEQVLSSLVKYIIRMTTRTTPYGLFSGVTRGSFGDFTTIKIEDCKSKKRARVDMEWLYSVIHKLENDRNILNEIKIISNDLAIVNGSRLDMNYICNYGLIMKENNLQNLTASIRNTKPVKLVMELANKLSNLRI